MTKNKGDGSKQPGNEQNPARSDKIYRGILNVLNALFNKYKSNSDEQARKEAAESKWFRAGVIAAIGYTGLTLILMFATVCQAWITRDQERRELRAYFGVTQIKMDCCWHVDKQGTATTTANVVRIYVKNVGQTPASDVRLIGNMVEYPFADAFPTTYNFNVPRSDGPPATSPTIESSLYILPQQEKFFSHAAYPPMVMRSQNQISKLIIYGHIEFTDIFSERHYVDFCDIYYIDAFNIEEYEPCPEHNGEEPP